MKKALKIFGVIILILVLLGAAGISVFTGRAVTEEATQLVSREETIQHKALYREEYEAFAAKYPVEEVGIPSTTFDYEIPGILAKGEGSGHVAVLLHGLGGTKTSMSAVAEQLLNLGFDVLICDQRNSGEHPAEENSFGILESYDALDALAYAREMAGPEGKVLLYGESFGGSTAVMAVARDATNVDALILDSPLTRGGDLFLETLAEVEAQEGIPASFMALTANGYARMKYGFSFSEANAADWIQGKELDFPVLLIASPVDEVLSYEDMVALYESLESEEKELYVDEKYGHIGLATQGPEEYRSLLEGFFQRHL
ncbi:MAG: alpha/beta fold hydrolase [Tissierellia bacterium]|nr:alpha/beta fold hydrolase [Tissierellia bacterium]